MHQETGHVNCTFRLARALQRRGCSVTYLATPDIEVQIRAQGFGAVSWFPDLFPSGWAANDQALGSLQRRRRISWRFEQITRRLINGEVDSVFSSADVVVVDVIEPLPALLCLRLARPLILANTALPQTWDPDIAPPRSVALSYPAVRWVTLLARRRALAILAGLVGAPPPYHEAERAVARFHLDARTLDRNTAYMPQVCGAPELVLCPDFLDAGRPPRDGRIYVESMDAGRAEPTFDWTRIDPDKPLIYCSMGTALYKPVRVHRFLAQLMGAMQARPDLQMVLASGRHRTPKAVPPNVVVIERAPQLAMLSRATAMITHAGLGSVKEAIWFGRPLIAVPLALDQPGNAARLVKMGIAVAPGLSATAPELCTAIDAVVGPGSLLLAAQRLAAQMRVTESGDRGADFVMRLARK
jgi:zeaxanthin glucosyltransferase